VEEASALGAALLAGVATGVYTSYEEAIEAAVKIKEPIGRGRKYIRNTNSSMKLTNVW